MRQHAFTTEALFGILHTSHYITLVRNLLRSLVFYLIPFTAFNDRAGKIKMSELYVNLAPGDMMGEDYKFTDGAKEPLGGGMGSAGKWQEWEDVYSVTCTASRIRFSDGSVWP